MEEVDTHTSDIWFNHDHSGYAPNYDRDGEHADWDADAMLNEADAVAKSINAIGGTGYTGTQLVEDFFARL